VFVCFFPPTFHNFDFLILKVVKFDFGLWHILKENFVWVCAFCVCVCVCVFVKVFVCLGFWCFFEGKQTLVGFVHFGVCVCL
jgi:hypothetical protein